MGKRNDAGRPRPLLTTELEVIPVAQRLDLLIPATRLMPVLVKLNYY